VISRHAPLRRARFLKTETPCTVHADDRRPLPSATPDAAESGTHPRTAGVKIRRLTRDPPPHSAAEWAARFRYRLVRSPPYSRPRPSPRPVGLLVSRLLTTGGRTLSQGAKAFNLCCVEPGDGVAVPRSTARRDCKQAGQSPRR
jgi:hypothetical protein